ncbi:hypothetical protein BGX38DRAFT_1102417, partial [Terfezia claveryi]
DICGAILSLAFSILLVFALEEGSVEFPYSSVTIIATLIVAVVCFILFVVWEEWVLLDHRMTSTDACQPIFPMCLTKHRLIARLLATGFLSGFPFMTAEGRHFQNIAQLSATATTKIRLYPLLLSSAFAIVVGAILNNVGKENTRLKYSPELWDATISSFTTVHLPVQSLVVGVGVILSSLVIACWVEVSEADIAVVMSAIVQVRVVRECIALAVCSELLSHLVEVNLQGVVIKEEMAGLLRSTQYMLILGQERFEIVRTVYVDGYADGYALRIMVIIAFAGAAVVTALEGLEALG